MGVVVASAWILVVVKLGEASLLRVTLPNEALLKGMTKSLSSCKGKMPSCHACETVSL